jgi:hypothetical membrane protein
MNSKDLFIKISALCGCLLPVLLIILLLVSINQAPWFSWTESAISDLGRPSFEIMCFNCGLIILGFLLFIFSIGLYFYLGGERVGPTILAISSIYFIGIGVYPLPDPNHMNVSGLFFIAFPLGFFVLGLQLFMKKRNFIHKMGYTAVIIGIISLWSTVLLIYYEGIAIPEFIILISGFMWCFIFGLYMLFF